MLITPSRQLHWPRWVLSLVLVGLLAACNDSNPPSETLAQARQDTPLEHARKHLDPKYVCPMHPQIVRDEPGTCPICGMDLVAREIDRSSREGPSVRVGGAIRQAMNLRTARVKRDTLWKYIKTVGRVGYDEKQRQHVHARASGWVERLLVRAEGEPVVAGQPLLALYAPEILNAQVDFLIALKQAAGNRQRLDSARNRLRLLAVPDDVIRRIEQRGEPLDTVPMRAPQAGVVTHLNIAEGMYVTPGLEILTLADLSSAWVLVDIFEPQIAWVAVGKSAEITVPAYPGKSWEGKVEYLYPELDPTTRTLRARLRFANPDQLLKPNMFAEVVIYGGPKRDALVIPREALIVTGEREAVVKRVDEETFQPVQVVVGMRREKQVEILSGLNEGEEIVVSGQFLVDSEANIQASFARLAEP